MITDLLDLFDDTLRQAERAAADIPDERMAEQPGGMVNHPAWTLSHLATSAEGILILMGDPPRAGAMDEFTRFGPGSTPSADRSSYASKAEILERLRSRHARAAELVRTRHATRFPEPAPEPLRQFGPIVGPLAIYLLAAHEPYHLGQLSQWKRGAGIAAR